MNNSSAITSLLLRFWLVGYDFTPKQQQNDAAEKQS
jgi:hypothetical protein